MLESAWLFVGRVAFAWTVLVAIAALWVNVRDDLIVIVGGTAGFVMWGVWLFGALNVEVASNGTVLDFAMPPVAVLGLVMALVNGYLAITGPIEVIARAQDTRLDDM